MDYEPEDFITLEEAAAFCHHKTPWLIRKLINRKELPVFRPSYKRTLIPRVAFNKWVAARIRNGWRPGTTDNNQAEE